MFYFNETIVLGREEDPTISLTYGCNWNPRKRTLP
jgi:hypothetical protein